MTGNRLFLKLSGAVLLLLLIVGAAYVAIGAYTTEDYFAEVNQKLYGSIADHTVAEVKPLVDGAVDTNQIKDIMHSMMVINPSVEVYLLRPDGHIITYVAPNKHVQLEEVDLAPVRRFLATGRDQRPLLRGDDPRHPERPNVFSAAEIRDEAGVLEGYVYIILSGEEHESVAQLLQGSYVRRTGLTLFFLSLLAAFGVGLLLMFYLTRNAREVVSKVERFQEGDYSARVRVDDAGEFAAVGQAFNSMAARIESNIGEMKQLDRLRRELIANISHDLRTPLAVMQGFVETLLMKNDTMGAEERARHLSTVFNSGERLRSLIGQLFEYSKLEARQIEPAKEAFDAGELALDVANKFSVLAEQRGVTVDVDVPRDLPRIFADLGLVERVLNNLMDNALKFTPSGGRVLLQLRPTHEAVEIRVADTGPGIPEAELPYVFDRYRKGERTRSGRNTGAGLGLAIVKKILELHDSGIEIQSKLREGTAFVFELRTAPAVA